MLATLLCLSVFGRVLPAAIIGMLVVCCLKDAAITAAPYGLPELLAAGVVAGVRAWKRNAIQSILVGTAVYMVLIRLMG